MSSAIVVAQAGEESRFLARDLPLSLGGDGGDVRIPGYDGTEPIAVVGFEGGDLFVQPVQDGGRVLCNGAPVSTSQWLRSGDVLRLEQTEITLSNRQQEIVLQVAHRAAERKTDPPLVQPRIEAQVETGEEIDTRVAPVEFTPASIQTSGTRRLRPSLGKVLVFSCLVVLAFVVWFLFTSRAVQVESDPLADLVAIEGTLLKVELAGRYLLRPGNYQVRIEKEGFVSVDSPLEVTREANQVYRFALEKLPGLLLITSRPNSNAEVVVDGESVGLTPLEGIPLREGEYQVEVVHPKYVPFSTTVMMEGSGTTFDLSVDLTPNWAVIEFDSRPTGAIIWVDGESIGKAPLVADVVAGSRQIEVKLPGYKPYRSRLLVQANVPQALPPVVLQPSDGVLQLTSQPEEATVSIAGEYVGQTPLEVELKPGKTYELVLSKLGYETSTETVEIVSGKSHEISIELIARYGEIEIDGRPADAELLVDGEAMGTANQTLRLQAIPHEILVRKSGFKDFRQTVTPRPGFPQQIQVTLLTPEEIRRAATPATLRTGQGQELVLIEPGSFRMGASRREPGRRANEPLRNVQLTRAFYVGVREVSNREFKKFRESHRSGRAESATLERDDHPVVAVTWEDAARYCNWLSGQESLPKAYVEKNGTYVLAQPFNTGYRLPTEAEWAWAARYGGQQEALKYPWGGSLPVPTGAGNYGDIAAGGLLQKTLAGYNDGFAATAPVDSFEASAVGLKNIGGNVAEWVNDFYSIPASTSSDVEVDPLGPAEAEHRVIRGSSWMDSTMTELRLSYRDYGSKARPDVGFRVARFAE